MPLRSEPIDRQRRVRRSAIVLSVVVLTFYFAFIVMSISRAS